jgi:teichuronic acid biosynthesis glycosyltransferase TuaG
MSDCAPVGVVIPAYNAATTIRRALLSVAAQSLKPTQVIVVDDGSTDDTETVARACSSEMPGVELLVVRQDNAGAGAARNRGVAEVSQPYIAFLDADDEWLAEKLERSMDVLTKGDFDLVAHDFYAHQNGEDQHVHATRLFNATSDPLSSLYVRGYIPSITVVVRKDLIDAVGGFDVTLPNAQDFDLWLAMLLQPNVRFTMFDEPLARYRQGQSGIMSHTERRLSCCLRIARRYTPYFSTKTHVMRILAVHKEAMLAHLANRKRVRAVLIPVRLIVAMFAELLASAFLGAGEQVRKPAIKVARLNIVSVTWAAGVLSLYIAQFGNVMNPILRILGLK